MASRARNRRARSGALREVGLVRAVQTVEAASTLGRSPNVPNTITVGDLMTSTVLSVGRDELLADVDVEMKFCHIRHMPVVDQKNRLLGMVSRRDVVRAQLNRELQAPVKVGQVMLYHLIRVERDTPVTEAIALMVENQISALPVVERESGELVGILTEADFALYVYQQIAGRPFVPQFAAMTQ